MKAEDKLKAKVGTDAGFRVPDGYFEAVFTKIDSELPERRVSPFRSKPSRWQRLKPYVYLAAMFAGIWCTMKMVNMISDSASAGSDISLDNPPALVAQAVHDPEVVASVVSPSTVMVVEDYDEDELPVEPESDGSEPEVSTGATEDYSSFVDVEDIDMNALRASLEDTDDEAYYYI